MLRFQTGPILGFSFWLSLWRIFGVHYGALSFSICPSSSSSSSSSFGRQRTTGRNTVVATGPLYNSHQENDEGIFYDDFDFPVGNSNEESNTSFAPDPQLQDRFHQLVASEQEIQAQVANNWRQGHWSVRGCSLDPGGAGFGEDRITISSMIPVEEDVILVGRTDGSLCWLQIGSEYLATFTSQLEANDSSNNTVTLSRQLRREESASVPMPMEDVSAPRVHTGDQKFKILAQLPPSPSGAAAIVDMVLLGDEEEASLLFTLSNDSNSASIRKYLIREVDGPVSSSGVTLPLPPMHTSVQSIHGIRNQYLLSVDERGTVNLWEVKNIMLTTVEDSCTWQSTLEIPLENDDKVLSCDVSDDFIYIGTALGYVLVFSVDQVLNLSGNQWLQPLKIIVAFVNAGVSAVCVAGEGVMGSGRSTPTLGFITGSTAGEIKQWELLPRSPDAVEYWPKMPNQKMPGKSHLLDDVAAQEAPVLAIRVVQDGVVLSATPNQLVTWDVATGKVLCTMEGMEFRNNSASFLVLSKHLLVTNGMKQYVCIHDYSIDPDLDTRDMIVPMDDGDE